MDGLVEIMEKLPVWVPYAATCGLASGFITLASVSLRKSQRKVYSEFQQLLDTYKDDFEKQELIDFYKKLVHEVKPSLIFGKRKKAADNLLSRLQVQLSADITEEIQESLKTPFTEKTTLSDLSETYKQTLGNPYKLSR